MHVKGGQAIVPNVVEAVEVARTRKIPVIWVFSLLLLLFLDYFLFTKIGVGLKCVLIILSM